MSFSDKTKFALWLYPETLKKVERCMEKADCRSKSEFIEQSIEFYYSYLTLDEHRSILPNAVVSCVKGAVDEASERICKLLFKLAVEQAISANVAAYGNDLTPESLERLKEACVKEVRMLNGVFTFDHANKWQNG